MTFDESETLAYMLIEPELVNHSSVQRNLRSAFKFLRLSCKADVPVFWLDGFATNEISGAFLRAAGVPFSWHTVAEALAGLDPVGRDQRYRHRVPRVHYNVHNANGMWHIDGYEHLVSWNICACRCEREGGARGLAY